MREVAALFGLYEFYVEDPIRLARMVKTMVC
jgi:hypothetical protein